MFETGNALLVAGVVILAVAILLFGQFAYWTWVSRNETKQRELARRLGTLEEQEATPLIKLEEKKVERQGFSQRLEGLIRQAGSPYNLGQLWQRVMIAAAVGVILAFAVFKSPAAVIGLGAGYLPITILGMQATSRMRKITEQLPDALDLLARSLQAGHGISDGMRMVAEEMPPPVSVEFGRVFEENNLGRDLRECFVNLCKRNPASFDLRLFSSSVLLQRDTGGNLVEILQGISTTIRNRFVFKGKVEALTAEARFTGIILAGLPFVVTLLLSQFSPDYLKPMITDPLGQLLTFGCICSFSLGVYIMRELAKVEV